MTKTLRSRLSDAELCRQNGWGPGTVLEGTEYGQLERIKITAVGEESILAIGTDGQESEWTLKRRGWRKVGNSQ